MSRPASLFRAARCASKVPVLTGLAAAQDGSVILKSQDALEKRVARVEGEVSHLRKAGPAPVAPAAFRPDTAAAALAVRLDSVSARLARLEKAPPAAPAAAPAAGAIPSEPVNQPSPEKDSIAVGLRITSNIR